MKVLTRAIVATCLAFGAGAAAHAASDASIAAFEQGQQAAWNAHDANAYAAAFAPDADVVTSLGWHWAGRDVVARNMGDGFRLIYARSVFRVTDIDVRTLSPDLTLVRITWSLSGARTPDGAASIGEQQGIETQLVQGRGEHRMILSQQDTILTSQPASAPQTTATQASATQAPAPAATSFPTTPPPVRRCIVARANGDCLVYGKPKPVR